MILMVIELSDFLSRVEAAQYTIFTQKFHSSVHKTLKKYNGILKKTDNNNYWVSFNSVNDAIQCALEVRHKFKYVTPKHKSFSRRLQMALTVSNKAETSSFTTAARLCEMTKDQVVIIEAVRDLYESKNVYAEIDKTLIRVLNPKEEEFLIKLSAYLSNHWANPDVTVRTLGNAFGLSYSQLHTVLIKLVGKTPNKVIKDYKLHKALELLYLRDGSISKIADKIGFSSPSYLSHCFLKKYGVRPSKYLQQHAV
jgi:AraC-like DNA-binding protein